MSGCVSDEERGWALYEATEFPRLMVSNGDTVGALRYLEWKVTQLPDIKTEKDSAYYAYVVLRLAFLDYFADSTGALSAAYYEHAYPYLRHLPEPSRIDGLRWTALVLAQRGDTARALAYLYESRHRAAHIGDQGRVAKADTCLSYLEPQELAPIASRAWPVEILIVGLLIFLSTLGGTAWAVRRHHRLEAPGPEPEPLGKPVRFPFVDPAST